MKRIKLVIIILWFLFMNLFSISGSVAGPLKIELANRLEALPFAVDMQGDYVYAVGKGSFTIYNMKDMANPRKTGGCRLPSVGCHISVKGDYATVACLTGGFFLVDIRNPEKPEVVGQIKSNDYPAWVAHLTTDVDYDGKLACLAQEKDGMALVDASSPAQLKVLYRYSADTIIYTRIRGTYVYGIGIQGFHTWDISNPREPLHYVWPKSINVYSAWDVDGKYLYLGGSLLSIYDISDPGNPVCVSNNLQIPENIYIKKQGNILHCIGSSHYTLVSVKDTSHPQVLTSSTTGLIYAHRVACDDSKSFVADIKAGLKCFTYSSTSLALQTTISGLGQLLSMDYHYPYLYVAEAGNGIGCYDVSSTHAPREVSRLNISDSSTLTYYDNHLYYMSVDTVKIISLSNGTGMNLVNGFSLGTSQYPLYPHRPFLFHKQHLYLPYYNDDSVRNNYLVVFDISTPEQYCPSSTVFIRSGYSYWDDGDLFGDDTILYWRYFGYDSSTSRYVPRLLAYDISNPLNPLFLHSYVITRTENPYLVRNNYFYGCRNEYSEVNSFSAYKVYFDSGSTQFLGNYSVRFPIVDYVVNGNRVCLLLSTGELVLLNISDPDEIRYLDSYKPYCYQTGFTRDDLIEIEPGAVRGDNHLLCVAEGAGGISIFQISSSLPSLKLKTGENKEAAYRLSDYFQTDSTAGYYIDKNALGLAVLNGDTVSQLSYSQPTVNYHQFAITIDDATCYAKGPFKYSSYKLSKLPEVVLSEGKTAKLDISGYLDKDESSEWPKSFGNQESLLVSDTASIQAHWDNSSTILINCLKSFGSPEWVDVIASPQSEGPYANAADQDRERIWIYPNAIPQGDFSSDTDTTLFALEPLEVGESMAPMEYHSSVNDKVGETAKGVLAFSFSSTASKVKGTLQFDSHIQYAANQWYRARMRVYSPEAGNAIEASLFNFNGIASSTARHVDVAGEIFFGVPTTWTWMDVPLYTHAADSGYAQFVLKGSGEGLIYIDDIQLFKGDPPIVNTRSLNKVSFQQGRFDEKTGLSLWAVETTMDSSIYPNIVDDDMKINMYKNGLKMTALTEAGSIYTPSTPIDKWMGIQMALSCTSIYSRYPPSNLILLGVYGVQNQGQYEIGIPFSELFASAELGKTQGGEYWVAGKALNPYHQVQLIIKGDYPGYYYIPMIDLKIDSDDPDYGDAELYPAINEDRQ